MALVQLKYVGVSEIVGSDEVGLLLLNTLDEMWQISMICEREMVRQFVLRQEDRRVTQRWLPEVLWSVITGISDGQFQLVITSVVDAQYTVMLYHSDTQMMVPVRASDAVLLSLVADIPVMIEENLLKKQALPNHDESKGVSIPINVLSKEMLQKALDRAIAEENYEEASHLRDELRRRESIGL